MPAVSEKIESDRLLRDTYKQALSESAQVAKARNLEASLSCESPTIKANKTSSSLRERFKFLREKHPGTYQKNLGKWNKRLDRVIDSASQAEDNHKAVVMQHQAKVRSSRLRTLSKRLFRAL